MAASSQQPGQQCPGLNQFSKDNVDDGSPAGPETAPYTRRHGPELWRHGAPRPRSHPSARMMTVNIRCYHCLLQQNNAPTASYNVSRVP